MSTVDELLGRQSSCPGLENSDYCRRDPSLTSSISGGRSDGIVSLRTKARSFFSVLGVLCDPGKGTSAVRNRYQKTGVGLQTERAKCVL
jgi:hypothetical protein